MITDADRMKWIAENVNYFEHKWNNTEGKYNFWPHEEEKGLLFDPEKVGMNIIEYIDSRIGEKK